MYVVTAMLRVHLLLAVVTFVCFIACWGLPIMDQAVSRKQHLRRQAGLRMVISPSSVAFTQAIGLISHPSFLYYSAYVAIAAATLFLDHVLAPFIMALFVLGQSAELLQALSDKAEGIISSMAIGFTLTILYACIAIMTYEGAYGLDPTDRPTLQWQTM